jgi:catechol-2,3-dioxygenase
MSFLTYDGEHHRLAIMAIPSLPPKVRHSAGLEHVAFTFPTLTALLTSYKQRHALGIEPVWCVNHGMTTSLYYKDPDGNNIETQIDNFGDDEWGNKMANEYMASEEVEENVIGVDFDPDELWAKLQKLGEEKTVEELRVRQNIGPRGIESVPAAFMA